MPGLDTTGFPTQAPQLVCEVQLKSAQHFLELFDKIFPLEYLYPIKHSHEGGYEIFQAIAAVGERLSLMCQRNECGMVILYSDGGDFATVSVNFSRPTAAAGAVTVKAGTIVTTSKGGRQFETTADAVFSGAAVGPITVLCKAVAKGYEYNVRGQRTSARGEVLPGEIDTIEQLILNPPFGDTTLVVSQIDDAQGGAAAWLDGHGNDRGVERLPGEPDDLYRIRVRTVPDTVTPDAIGRAATNILGRAGIEWEFVETFDIGYQTCWDCPSSNIGTPTYQATLPPHPRFSEDTFVYDDPRSPRPFRNRWLDELELRGAFILLVDVTMPPTPDQAEAIATMYRKLQQIRLAGVAAIMDNFHSW